MNNSRLLEEIADSWRLEARDEDNERYFYSIREVKSVMNGRKTFVIGRKGAGKTAISEYVSQSGMGKESGIFTEKLKFKNFPFNKLYRHSNSEYTPPNQYITLWKHLIYSTICKMMLRNKQISEEVQEYLDLSYTADKITSLPRLIAEWTDENFEIWDAENESGRHRRNSEVSWITKVDILEDIILKNLDDSKYYIVFDELDEDYRNIKQTENFELYTNLITSLLKAVQDVRSTFRESRYNIFPIVFLRDDIYGLIKDADKNKWSDFKVELDWNVRKIQELIAFRISRAKDPSGNTLLSFEDAWKSAFYPAPVMMGSRKRKAMPSFKYMANSTQLRPRDFIKYIGSLGIQGVMEKTGEDRIGD